MGYFSNLAIEEMACDHDHSYALAEHQLLRRLEELEARLEAPSKMAYESRFCFSDDDLRYILPEYLTSLADIKAARELAIRDLAERYGIHIREEADEDVVDLDEMQISFSDVLRAQFVA